MRFTFDWTKNDADQMRLVLLGKAAHLRAVAADARCHPEDKKHLPLRADFYDRMVDEIEKQLSK